MRATWYSPRTFGVLGIGLAILLGATLIAGGGDSSSSDDKTAEKSAESVTVQPEPGDGVDAPEDEESIPTELEDSAFDHFVDLATVRTAILERNPATLLDSALLAAEGERVLFRARKGINANRLLQLSVRLATEKRDKTTLERLTKVAEARQDKQLSELLANAKLGSASRAVAPGLNVSVEQIDPQTVQYIQACVNGIEQARLLGNPAALKQLEDALPQMEYLNDAQKALLKKRIGEARAAMPEKPDPDDPVSKLMASSRGWSIGPVKGDWPPRYTPSGGTQFVGSSRVKRVYTAHYKVVNKTSSPITIRVYSDSSTLNGKDWTVNARSTRSFNSTLTTTWSVGGNSGAAPNTNDSRTHPWFVYRGNKTIVWDGESYQHSGSTAFLRLR